MPVHEPDVVTVIVTGSLSTPVPMALLPLPFGSVFLTLVGDSDAVRATHGGSVVVVAAIVVVVVVGATVVEVTEGVVVSGANVSAVFFGAESMLMTLPSRVCTSI